ncbi:MAG: hypothetical protein KME26_28880 [Oscillatoria princeps RMCB-10]|nr:hypothetical protein [Oscillatoria princeps RMCB-10]
MRAAVAGTGNKPLLVRSALISPFPLPFSGNSTPRPLQGTGRRLAAGQPVAATVPEAGSR